MKSIDIFRNSIIKGTLDEVERNLEAQRQQLLKGRGSWKIRSMGVADAITIVQRMKELLLSENV